jgi:hypothetical protein
MPQFTLFSYFTQPSTKMYQCQFPLHFESKLSAPMEMPSLWHTVLSLLFVATVTLSLNHRWNLQHSLREITKMKRQLQNNSILDQVYTNDEMTPPRVSCTTLVWTAGNSGWQVTRGRCGQLKRQSNQVHMDVKALVIRCRLRPRPPRLQILRSSRQASWG